MNSQDRIERITIGSQRPPNVAASHLFTGLRPQRGLVFLLGPPKVGKSLFVMWLSACLATGNRVFSCSAEQRKRYGEDFAVPRERGGVLYVAAEDGDIAYKRVEGALQHLRTLQEAAVARLPNNDLPIITYPFGGLKLDSMVFVKDETKDSRAILESVGYPVRLIVFDTLAAAFAIRDENDNAKMQELVRALRNYAVAFDALVLAVAHPKKNGRRNTGQIRGAGSVTASADAVLEMSALKVRDGTKRCVIRVASIRDGACAGETFEFAISPFEGAPAIYPIENRQKTSNDKSGKPALTEKQIVLLENFEMWSLKHGQYDCACAGPVALGLSLEQMVDLQFETEAANVRNADKATVARAKDRIRKQVGRDGLYKLTELGLCQRYEVDGKPCFRPATDWDAMTEHVEASYEAAYRSQATRQREQINLLYASTDRECEAITRAQFRALDRIGARVRQLDSLRNRPK